MNRPKKSVKAATKAKQSTKAPKSGAASTRDEPGVPKPETKPESSQPAPVPDSTDNAVRDLSDGVAGLFTAALDVAVAVARTFERATAPNNAPPHVRDDASRLEQVVGFSVATLTNVIRVAVAGATSGVGSRKPAAPAQPAAAAESAASEQGAPAPRLRRGATLRIPLVVENQGDQDLVISGIQCSELTVASPGEGLPLEKSAFRFQPASLTLQPKDFEKLTVFVTAGPYAATGTYTATLAAAEGGFAAQLTFELVE
jgi:hypothetical protein